MKKSAQERGAINRMLMSHGLGRLEDGAGLMASLGFLVENHEHLRTLFARCEPEERRSMYDALTPYLHFQAHSLDWYIARSAEKAERDQLPTIEADGSLKWPSDKTAPTFGGQSVDTIAKDLADAQTAVNDQLAKYHLTLTCRKCTREESFTGDRKADAVLNARLAGWTYDEIKGDGREICPACPGARVVVN